MLKVWLRICLKELHLGLHLASLSLPQGIVPLQPWLQNLCFPYGAPYILISTLGRATTDKYGFPQMSILTLGRWTTGYYGVSISTFGRGSTGDYRLPHMTILILDGGCGGICGLLQVDSNFGRGTTEDYGCRLHGEFNLWAADYGGLRGPLHVCGKGLGGTTGSLTC